MTRLLPAALFLATLVTPPDAMTTRGYASRYDPGVFENVVAHRFAQGWWRNEPPRDWHTVSGYAATTDCDQVGTIVLMRPVGAIEWERVLIADCAGDGATLSWMTDNSIIAELDYPLFTRWSETHGLPLEIETRPYGIRFTPGVWVI